VRAEVVLPLFVCETSANWILTGASLIAAPARPGPRPVRSGACGIDQVDHRGGRAVETAELAPQGDAFVATRASRPACPAPRSVRLDSSSSTATPRRLLRHQVIEEGAVVFLFRRRRQAEQGGGDGDACFVESVSPSASFGSSPYGTVGRSSTRAWAPSAIAATVHRPRSRASSRVKL
jgi:hypothetical protein